MSPFTKMAPAHGAELKAVVFALLVCGLFIAFLTVVRPPSRRTPRLSYGDVAIPTPMPLNKLMKLSEPPPVDPTESFRVVPESFKLFNFRVHSYGLYTFADGRQIQLTLQGSDLTLPNRSGWFSLRDVYYTDLTGDDEAEAIVRLSRVECNGSCNGGADLFYIYAVRNGRLKNLWQYETGRYGYGCSLKSLILSKNQLVLELYGRCPKQGMDYLGASKFVVEDLTFILFEFDGRRFKQKSIEFFETSINVRDFESTIRIF